MPMSEGRLVGISGSSSILGAADDSSTADRTVTREAARLLRDAGEVKAAAVLTRVKRMESFMIGCVGIV